MTDTTEWTTLLAAPPYWRAELARQILGDPGIPTVLRGLDWAHPDSAPTAGMLGHPDVLVPRNSVDHCKTLLTEAWGQYLAAELWGQPERP